MLKLSGIGEETSTFLIADNALRVGATVFNNNDRYVRVPIQIYFLLVRALIKIQ